MYNWDEKKLWDVLARPASTELSSLPTHIFSAFKTNKTHPITCAKVGHYKPRISRYAGKWTSSPGCYPHTILMAQHPKPLHSVLETDGPSSTNSSLLKLWTFFFHFLILIETWVFPAVTAPSPTSIVLRPLVDSRVGLLAALCQWSSFHSILTTFKELS